MPVLEILQLRVKEGISSTDPSILRSMQTVRSGLEKRITATESRFYQCIEDPTLIYIFGIWQSVAAHEAFLASPEKHDILKPQEGIFQANWMIHIPISSMADMPFDAPVMAIARMHVKSGDHVAEFNRMLPKRLLVMKEGNQPWKMVTEWRCDSKPGQQEMDFLIGCESLTVHDAVIDGVGEDPGCTCLRDYLESKDIMHAKNMER